MDEDQEQFQGLQAEPPVRSRWAPKPDQILILESIFNSGMVNPPKDETVRIRKLLEKFGPVADANVFYWFQNRRSRSRRRQRQIQNAAAAADQHPRSSAQQLQLLRPNNNNNVLHYDHPGNSTYSTGSGSGSSFTFGPDGRGDRTASEHILSFSGNPMQGFDQSSHQFGDPETSILYNFQPPEGGIITVFINGVATEVGGQQGYGLDMMRAMFGGDDFILCHSSGVPVVDIHTLTHGESYFLVPRHC